MRYAIIKAKQFTQDSWDREPVIADVEIKLPIQRQEGDVFYCTDPDGSMRVLHIDQIAAIQSDDA